MSNTYIAENTEENKSLAKNKSKKDLLIDVLQNNKLMDSIQGIMANVGELYIDSKTAEGLLRDFPILGSVLSLFGIVRVSKELKKTHQVLSFLQIMRLNR